MTGQSRTPARPAVRLWACQGAESVEDWTCLESKSCCILDASQYTGARQHISVWKGRRRRAETTDTLIHTCVPGGKGGDCRTGGTHSRFGSVHNRLGGSCYGACDSQTLSRWCRCRVGWCAGCCCCGEVEIRYVQGPAGPAGPAGAQGERGATGAAGAQGQGRAAGQTIVVEKEKPVVVEKEVVKEVVVERRVVVEKVGGEGRRSDDRAEETSPSIPTGARPVHGRSVISGRWKLYKRDAP